MVNGESEEERLFKGIARLNSRFLGLILGLFMGLGVFVATNWIVLKGGHIAPSGEYVVGPHLQLLSQFFIGYEVSFWGSIIGFLYGFALGSLAGTAMGMIYNKIVDLRS
jgi:hypothetical protein